MIIQYIDSLFWFLAVAGTLLFAFRVLMMLIGFGHEDLTDPSHADQDFKILSLHAMTGFSMIFGWSGLAALHQFQFPLVFATLTATGCGFLAILIQRLLFSYARKLISPGRDLKLKNIEGKRGNVYQRIPSKGSGKVILTVNGFQHELEAVAAHSQEIPSFTEVQIVQHMSGDRVSVIPIDK